tara:strand:+ start:1741 stop:2319 length:579 start_codon:yes stop_codon:yes gene_type:complete
MKKAKDNCKCVCEPPKRRKRRAPVYSRPPPPQFYLSGLPPAVPVPTIADTVRLAVRDEFEKRHHLPMPNREPFYAKPLEGISSVMSMAKREQEAIDMEESTISEEEESSVITKQPPSGFQEDTPIEPEPTIPTPSVIPARTLVSMYDADPSSVTVNQMRDTLSAVNMPISGNKSQLLNQLRDIIIMRSGATE